jgi:alkylated DNA repair dioxygenase AlkB
VSQLLLFSPVVALPPIDGLSYASQFVSESEERRLIACIDREPWSHEYKRRRQHYGVAYDDAPEPLEGRPRSRPMPDWVRPLAERIHHRGFFEAVPNGCLVNEYLPGQGIAPHHDRPGSGAVVASVSLGSGCLMDLLAGDERHAIWLEPRSLLVLAGEARSRFMHGIAPRKSDLLPVGRIQRRRRLSITLRLRG